MSPRMIVLLFGAISYALSNLVQKFSFSSLSSVNVCIFIKVIFIILFSFLGYIYSH
jgi:hypothetical protein